VVLKIPPCYGQHNSACRMRLICRRLHSERDMHCHSVYRAQHERDTQPVVTLLGLGIVRVRMVHVSSEMSLYFVTFCHHIVYPAGLNVSF
jgi:hypothetical protein